MFLNERPEVTAAPAPARRGGKGRGLDVMVAWVALLLKRGRERWPAWSSDSRDCPGMLHSSRDPMGRMVGHHGPSGTDTQDHGLGRRGSETRDGHRLDERVAPSMFARYAIHPRAFALRPSRLSSGLGPSSGRETPLLLEGQKARAPPRPLLAGGPRRSGAVGRSPEERPPPRLVGIFSGARLLQGSQTGLRTSPM